jgi:hypothetical protein
MTSAALTCAAASALAPDLALGSLSGDERAALLDHLTACPSCEALVMDLAGVVDTLLLLTPEADPPPGFESAVLSRIAASEAGPAGAGGAAAGPVAAAPLRRSGRVARVARSRWLLPAAAVVVAVAVTVPIVAESSGGRPAVTALDRQYAGALATLGGRELRAAPLVSPTGKTWGQAFVYEGTTSWVFVTMKWDVPNGPYEVVLDRRDGQPAMSLSGLRLIAGEGSFGHNVGDTADVARVRVVDAAGHTLCTATLPTDTA